MHTIQIDNEKDWISTSVIVLIIVLAFLLFVSACQQPPITEAGEADIEGAVVATERVTDTPEPEHSPTITITPTITSTPSPTITPTPIDYETIACYSEDLPYAWAESAAVLGWKFFADKNELEYRLLYFPSLCSEDAVEQDLTYLLYDNKNLDETIFLLLDERNTGFAAKFHQHLAFYDFWAMGPEDYPMLVEGGEEANPNLLFFRTDRLNGEGFEGNEILQIMIGLGEHEYIHTVQGRNNRRLALDIWEDPIYQAAIEFYANMGNNAAHRYFRANSAYFDLMQMLSLLHQMEKLASYTEAILDEMGITLEAYKSKELVIYDANIRQAAIAMAGNNYLAALQEGEISPLMLATRIGMGDKDTYELVRTLYDRHVAETNLWYYGSDTTNYLPATFDELFRPN
jgi:hypothetical protein